MASVRASASSGRSTATPAAAPIPARMSRRESFMTPTLAVKCCRMSTLFKLVTTVALAGAAFAPLAAQAPSMKSTDSKNAGWTQLFDGKTLKGWRGYKKPDTKETRWKVEDGMLTIPQTGEGDTKGQRDIITLDTFTQFDLRWEWKISQGGNSG